MDLSSIATILQITGGYLLFAFYTMAIIRIALTMRIIKYLHENKDKVSYEACYGMLNASGLDVDAVRLSFETKQVGDWSKYKMFSLSVSIVYVLIMGFIGLAAYLFSQSWIFTAFLLSFPWIMLQCFANPQKTAENKEEEKA